MRTGDWRKGLVGLLLGGSVLLSGCEERAAAGAAGGAEADVGRAASRLEEPNELSVVQALDVSTALAGAETTFHFVVANNSPVAAPDVVFSDTLPEGVTFVSCHATAGGTCEGSGNARAVRFASLPARTAARVTLVARLGEHLAHNALLNSVATVTSPLEEPHPGDNTTYAQLRVRRPGAVGANAGPAVDPGADQARVAGQQALLRGAASDDGLPQGAALTARWTKVAAPAYVVVKNPGSLEASSPLPVPGVYVFSLRVSDSDIASTRLHVVTVAPADGTPPQVNRAPTVGAGADAAVQLPGTLALEGRASDDGLPAGAALTTLWSAVSGPGPVSFADASARATTATFPAPGTYVLRLTASDTELSGADELTVTVTAAPRNQAPVVSAGADLAVALPASARLEGAASDDGLPAGGALTLQWARVSGPGTVAFSAPGAASTEASFGAPGTYVLRLTATDAAGLGGSDELTVTVDPQNRAPVVAAGPDARLALPLAALQLSGSASDDGLPRGSALSTRWSQVAGPAGAASFADAGAPSTQATFSQAGTYVLRLTAGDGALEALDELTVVVDPENRAPVVSAGADQTLALPASALLQGAASDDGQPAGGGPLALRWTRVSGPGAVTFSAPADASTRASFGQAGVYVLRLTATDAGGLSGSDELTVTVDGENQAPVVAAGPDARTGLPGAGVPLAGSASDDGLPRGSALALRWSQVGGPAGAASFADAAAAATRASFSQAGTYVLRLTASDGALESRDELTVVVDPENLAPVVSAGADQALALPAEAQLQGTASDDGLPAGGALALQWTRVSGPGAVTFSAPTAASTRAAFGLPGTYVLRLTATDAAGLSGSDDVSLTVDAENQAPLVAAGPDARAVMPGAGVQLAGGVSDDGLPRGSTLTLRWSQVGGPSGGAAFADASALSTQATFARAGTYVLRLTASDGALEGRDELTVEVEPENLAPVVAAGADVEVVLPGGALLAGTATDDGFPRGAALSFLWSAVEGPGSVTFGTPGAASTPATFSAPGRYTLRLTVSDSQRSGSDELVVQVRPPPNLAPVVEVGPPLSVAVPGTLALEGRATDDGQPDGVLLTTWSQVSGPAAVSFTDASAASTTARFTAAGSYVLRLTASDGALEAHADVAVTATLLDTNTAPRITSAPVRSAVTGVHYTYLVRAEDAEGDALAFALVRGPAGMTLDAASGVLSWRPGPSATGAAEVALRVADPAGLSDTQTFQLAVAAGTAPPRITSEPPLVATAGALYAYAATATDPDDAALAWSVTGPPGMAVDAGGRVTWGVPSGASGSFAVALTVRDAAGHTATQAFSVSVPVAGDATPPTVALTAPAANERITTARPVVGTATDSDLAGYTVQACRLDATSACTTLERGLRPVTASRLADLDPLALADGRYALVLTATDAGGRTSTARTEVTVQTGARKHPALRLKFAEFELRTRTAELSVSRVYDGLDLTDGPLGRGWRYEWDAGALARPRPLAHGWQLVISGRFVPVPSIRALVDHPVTVRLADGRVYEFDVTLQHQGAISSINPCRPVVAERGTTGATLELLRPNLTPYSASDYELNLINSVAYEDVDLENEFNPAFARLRTPFGEELVFAMGSSGKVRSIREPDGTFVELLPAGVRLDGRELLRLETGADGRISRATETLQNASARYLRDASGNLVQATTADGQVQTFEYDAEGRMVSYSAPGSGAARYEYDARGRVVAHHGPGGSVMRTEYDDAARTVRSTDAAGNSVLQEYDAEGNVVRVVDPLGNTTRFAFRPGTSLMTSKTDALGHTWQMEYDAYGRPTATVNPLGERTSQALDARTGRVLSATDGEGRVFTEQVDASGRVTAHVLPDGTVARRFSYPSDLTVVSTDPQGRSTTTVYDEQGRELSQTDSRGNASATAYDDVARVATVTQADGSVSRLGYDTGGRMTSLQMPGAGSLEYVYGGGSPLPDAVVQPDGSRLELRRNASGKVTDVVAGGRTLQQSRFDALGRLTSAVRNGRQERYEYDAAGRMTAMRTPEGSVHNTFDAAGRLLTQTSSDGRTTTYTRDAAGQVVSVTDGTGKRYDVAYDRSGRIRSVLADDGRRYELTYDANGEHNGTVLPGGVALSWTNAPSTSGNDEGPISARTDLEGVAWAYGYDEAERLTSVTDALGATARFERDGLGRVTRLVDVLGREQRFAYAGSALSRWTSAEGREQSFTYDGAGRQLTWTRADGTVVASEYAGGRSVTRLPDGQVHEVVDDPERGTRTHLGGAGGDVSMVMDADQQVTALQASDGARVRLAYTQAGQLQAVEAFSPQGARFATGYAYDAAGRVTAVTGPDGTTTRYAYDLAGRLATIERPNGTRTVFGYGAHLRPTRIEHFSGGAPVALYTYAYDSHARVVGAGTPQGSFEYGYDALGRLSEERRLEGGAVVETRRRTYDGAGNLLSVTDARGTTTYTYDRDDRLLGASGPGGAHAYAYNGRGALTTVTTPEGVTRYAYDALDRLTGVTLPDGRSVAYAYDSAGRLLARTDGSGTRRCLPLPVRDNGYDDCALEYSADGGAAEARVFGPEGLVALHGEAGTRHTLTALQDSVVGVTGSAGQVLGTAGFSPFGEQAASGERVGYGFNGERQDPLTGLVFLRARWYHPATGRFLTPDRFGAESADPRTLHRYAYALGNPLNRVDPSGEFGLASISISLSIQDTLQGIETGVKMCFKKRFTRKLAVALAGYAAERAARRVFEAALSAANPLGAAFVTEKEFHKALADVLCGDRSEGDEIAGMLEFEVKIDRCGNRVDRKTHAPQAKKKGAAYADCFSDFKLNTGIDIVFGGFIPIELKRGDADTMSMDQVERYCRFGALNGLHAAIYAFSTRAPSKAKLTNAATTCFKCWDSAEGKACKGNNTAMFGSAFIGVAFTGKGVDVFFPDVKDLCN
jgi:RHS repeat-associated protein/uncharacterized repeat protein (TIGR01451 family)